MENPISLSVVKGTTSKRVQIFIGSSAVTTGAGLSGLAFGTASLTAYYVRDGDASATSITLVNAAVGTFTSGGFKEISSANMTGYYEFGVPNACLATGANFCHILLQGAANMRPTQICIELTGVDVQDAVRGGMTALPNAAAAAAGGLWILGSNNTAAITVGAVNTGAFQAASFASLGTMTLNALTVTNNFTVSGQTIHTGPVTLSSTLSVVGAVNFASSVTLSSLAVTLDFGVGGDFSVTNFNVATNLNVVNQFNVAGAVTFGATFDVLGAFTVGGLVTYNTFTVTGATHLTGAVTLGNTLGITGAVTLSSTLGVGAVTLNALTVSNNLLVSGTTTLTGAVSLGSTLGVTGAITATNASNNIKGVDVTRWLGTTVSTPTVAGVPNVNAKTWNDLATVALPLIPTVAGRTLDVSAGGEAGIDWNNVGTPSATVNLSNTRLALVDLVTTVTNNPNAGNGAYSVQATATDGTNPLAQVTVRVTSGINTFSSVSDASGHVNFSLDAGTYTVSATKGGYEFTPSTRTVTGNNAGTLYTSPIALTAVVIPVAPVDPSLCRIYGYLRNTRTLLMLQNAEVIATLNHSGPAYSGGFLVGRERRTVTNSAGLFQLDVPQSDQITPTGTKWKIRCKEANIEYEAAFNDATFNLNSVLPS